jgi:hypothetical protein
VFAHNDGIVILPQHKYVVAEILKHIFFSCQVKPGVSIGVFDTKHDSGLVFVIGAYEILGLMKNTC